MILTWTPTLSCIVFNVSFNDNAGLGAMFRPDAPASTACETSNSPPRGFWITVCWFWSSSEFPVHSCGDAVLGQTDRVIACITPVLSALTMQSSARAANAEMASSPLPCTCMVEVEACSVLVSICCNVPLRHPTNSVEKLAVIAVQDGVPWSTYMSIQLVILC